jgi:hypothetical protein
LTQILAYLCSSLIYLPWIIKKLPSIEIIDCFN